MRSPRGHSFFLALETAILGLILAISAPAFSTRCDDEMNTIAGLMRLIESGLTLGEINPEGLASSTLAGDVRNPFRGHSKSPGNLSMTQKFDQQYRKLNPEKTELFRSHVRDVIAEFRSGQGKVEGAKDKTKLIPFIKLEKTFNKIQARGDFTQGLFQGRPVFVGRFDFGPDAYYFLIDEYNPDSARRIVMLGEEPVKDPQRHFGGTILKWKERDIFISHQTLKGYDLATGTELPALANIAKMNPHWSSNYKRLKSAVFPVGDILRVISAYETEARGTVGFTYKEIVSLDIDGLNEPKFKLLTEDLEILKFRPNLLTGHFVIAPVAKDFDVPFIDISNAKIFNLPAEKGENLTTHLPPLPYSEDGKWLAVMTFKRILTKSNTFEAGIYDLHEKRRIAEVDLRPIDVQAINSWDYMVVDGRPYVVVHHDADVSLLDLSLKKVLWTVATGAGSDFAVFHLNEEPLVVVSTASKTELQIREFHSGKIRATRKIPTMTAMQIMTYSINGMPMALVTQGDSMSPLIFNLAGEAAP